MILTTPLPPGFGMYLRDAGRTPLLTPAEERALAARVRGGDLEARDRLVRANLRLVVSIARGYAGRGLPVDDLVAEGNLGLIRAAEGYDPGMNTRFSTYAAYWIRQSIRRGLVNTARTIRLPAYLLHLVARWGRAARTLADELGRPPTAVEVAGRLGLSSRKGRLVADAVRVARTASAGTPADDGPDAAVADRRAEVPGAALEAAGDLARLGEGLGTLDPRAAAVVRLRFGLGGGPPLTLQDIGTRIGVTRERVRQIETESLAKLGEHLDPTTAAPARAATPRGGGHPPPDARLRPACPAGPVPRPSAKPRRPR